MSKLLRGRAWERSDLAGPSTPIALYAPPNVLIRSTFEPGWALVLPAQPLALEQNARGMRCFSEFLKSHYKFELKKIFLFHTNEAQEYLRCSSCQTTKI